MSSSPPLAELVGIGKRYETLGEPVMALRDVSLTICKGEFVAIMGSSGSGKTTLLHLLAGLDTPTAGSVVIEGRNLAAMRDVERTLFRRRRLGIVFQAYNLLPTLTATENVALPALLDGVPSREAETKARELLARLDLELRVEHRPQALSGGEQQRVAIARALMNDPALLLADEPTGNLDSVHGAAIWERLASLARDEGTTIVAVTHEPDGAAHADRVVVLRDGCIVGEIIQEDKRDAATLAARYRELVG